MLDNVNVHHHAANFAVIAAPMVGILMRADTWAIISGIFASIYYAIIIGNEIGRWVRHWKNKNKPKE